MILADLKGYLRVTHSSDDALLQLLLDGATDEAMRFCNRFTADMPEVTPNADVPAGASFDTALALLVMAKYEMQDAEKVAGFRRAAETLLMPFRVGMGV